jgi:hypothetical protein
MARMKETGVNHWRTITIELVRALGVLALVFLCFVHAPAPVSAAPGFDYASVTSASFCGAPDDPGSPGHAPCHACRIFTGLDLPPAPCSAQPAYQAVLAIAYADAPATPDVVALLSRANPRGPPSA